MKTLWAPTSENAKDCKVNRALSDIHCCKGTSGILSCLPESAGIGS